MALSYGGTMLATSLTTGAVRLSAVAPEERRATTWTHIAPRSNTPMIGSRYRPFTSVRTT